MVSQEDIDNATQQLSGTSRNAALDEMKQQLSDEGWRPIDETIGEGKPTVQASPGLDKEASETKVTMTITYNLTGVKDDDLLKILDNEVSKKLGDSGQNVRDNGLGTVDFTKVDNPDESQLRLTMQTVATTGPDIDPEQVKNDVIGKKRGEIESMLEDIDGVRSVSVEYSPVWVTTTPKSAEKITVVFEENND